MRGVLVHQLPHPVHAHWADAAGLELHPWLPRQGPYRSFPRRDLHAAWHIPRAPVAVAEGGGPAGACAMAKVLLRTRKAIVLAADETWARAARGVGGPLLPEELRWWRRFGGLLDGAIAVSPYVRDDLRALLPDIEVHVVRPFVTPGVRATLEKLDPALDGERILHLANPGDKNGTPLVLDAFQRVLRVRPGARLDLIGAGSREHWEAAGRPDGVTARGRVPDVAPHLEAADVFVMPGLGQACPVATLEAMTAAVPTLVSTETGTKDLAAAAGDGLVAEPEADALADALLTYLDLPVERRRVVGAHAREQVLPITPEAQSAAFVDALDRLTGRR